jgi:hypothetical protein
MEGGDLRGSIVNFLDFNEKIDFGILIALLVLAFCIMCPDLEYFSFWSRPPVK